MTRLHALVAILAAVAGPAMAQQTLSPGQTVTGELSTSDPTLDDGSHYDCFVVPTRQGQRLQIDQTSEAFDSYLTVGLGTCEALIGPVSDDDGGDGLNSRLVHVAPGGTLTILVNSLEPAKTGAYRLSVAEMSGGTPTPGNDPLSLTTVFQGSALLAQVSCQRLGEVVVASQALRANVHRIDVSAGRPGQPEVARLQPRVDEVAAWLTANGYSPSRPTEAESLFRRTSLVDQLTEFERRCSP